MRPKEISCAYRLTLETIIYGVSVSSYMCLLIDMLVADGCKRKNESCNVALICISMKTQVNNLNKKGNGGNFGCNHKSSHGMVGIE